MAVMSSHFRLLGLKFMNINQRIATKINELEQIKLFRAELEQKELQVNESLKNLVNKYIQDHDGVDVESLVRFLYWYSQLSATEISELCEVSTQMIVSISGSISFDTECVRCGRHYTAIRTSRSDISYNVCPVCIAEDRKKQESVFLEDWTIPKKKTSSDRTT